MKALRSAAGIAIVLGAACTPIEGHPRPVGPVNTCPCDGFPVDSRNRTARCDGGESATPARAERCVYGAFGGDPGYDFTIVVHVPTTSYFAPGSTFLLTKADLTALSRTTAATCKAPDCYALRQLVPIHGIYTVLPETFAALGAPFTIVKEAQVPVDVTLLPRVGTTVEASVDGRDLGLPLDPLLATSVHYPRMNDENAFDTRYARAVSTGVYERFSYPEAPYDMFVPPLVGTQSIGNETADDIVLAKANLDTDADPAARRASFVRDDGLQGFRAWIAQKDTGRRVSVIAELAGTTATPDLFTVGQTKALSDSLLTLVLVPPAGSIALPTLKAELENGAGIGAKPVPQIYPRLPGPLEVNGLVGSRDSGELRGIASKLFFRSTALRELDGKEAPKLSYETTVSTDDAGGFVTVLPPGRYDVFVEPLEGTGLSKFVQAVDIASSALTLTVPSRRTVATGRAVLADGRPLKDADVLFMPSKAKGAPGEGKNLDIRQREKAAAPRSARARTDADGNFRAEVDRGDYEVWVDPQAGSGFPRVVTLRPISGDTLDLGSIEVPLPTRIAFELRDPKPSLNPIAHAFVRVYAKPVCDGVEPCPNVEVAGTLTDERGKCEILLAPQPR